MSLRKIAVFTAIFICLVSLWVSIPTTYTEISIAEKRCKISAQDFDLQWKHSVEKTLWLENYQREQQYFVLRYTDLISFGAGTPTNFPIIFQKDGRVRMSIQQKIPEIHWTISRNMQGTIKVQQRQWLIYKDFPDYTVVNILVQQQPLWKTWTIGECL